MIIAIPFSYELFTRNYDHNKRESCECAPQIHFHAECASKLFLKFDEETRGANCRHPICNGICMKTISETKYISKLENFLL